MWERFGVCLLGMILGWMLCEWAGRGKIEEAYVAGLTEAERRKQVEAEAAAEERAEIAQLRRLYQL